MAFPTGSRLGSYEIRGPLGAGGMAEVYRAHDEKLGREVAIKVLPPGFAHDEKRLARFKREAHALAALNHPHIAAIYGVGDVEGTPYLVLELVPGQNLAKRLAQGPLDLSEGLRIARQITEALSAAHERGIVHRDLKPANIQITPDGTVKVLDFGLALNMTGEVFHMEDSPTLTARVTADGMMIGTPNYMSPEQMRGKAVDKRTDIWAFGCVLFELLVGRGVFESPTVTDVIAAVLNRDPDWNALPETAPAGVKRLLRRCLARDVAQRLADIADARIEIDELLAGGGSMETAVTREGRGPARMSKTQILGLVAAAGAVAGVAYWAGAGSAYKRRAPAAEPVLGIVASTRVTDDPMSESPAWSPDGRSIAFASNRSGNFEIYVRRIEGGQEVNISNDPGDDIQPAFSPDGESVAFVSTRSSHTAISGAVIPIFAGLAKYGGDVWVAPVLGGQARRVAENGNSPTWHPGGRRLAFVSGQDAHRSIIEVDRDSGLSRVLLPQPATRQEIGKVAYSPDGSWVTFETRTTDAVWIMAAAGGAPRQLFVGFSHAWDPSGKFLYFALREIVGGTKIHSVPMNGRAGGPGGPPRTIGVASGTLTDLAISPDGNRLLATEYTGAMNLARLPLVTRGDAPLGPEEVLHRGQTIDSAPDISRDGRRVAFTSHVGGTSRIWVLDLATNRFDRPALPGDYPQAFVPHWMPDGKNLVVALCQQGCSLWLLALDGSRTEELIHRPFNLAGGYVSPDGRSIAYSSNDQPGAPVQLFLLDPATRKSRPLTTSPGDKFSQSWSPDGRWLLYASNETGTFQIGKVQVETGQEQVMTSGTNRIRHGFFSPDGRFIYFQPNHENIFRMPAGGGVAARVTNFSESGLQIEDPTLSPDGRYIYYSHGNGGASVWMFTVGDLRPLH